MGLFRLLLWPLSLVYGMVVGFRNKLFDWGILPSDSFPVPVICVGNLSMGGTGKTPHVEFLIRLLQTQYKIAVLSRGYKRTTRGYLLAQANPSAKELGDEACQIKRKFPETLVAVDEKRKRGIARILKEHQEIDLIILDDAFQHRYVKPSLSLLLSEYYKPFFDNFLLPCGSLRESKNGIKRANALIITKTPAVFSPLDKNHLMVRLQPYRPRKVFFSSLRYCKPVSLWGSPDIKDLSGVKTIFLLTGIANLSSLEEHLKKQCSELFVHSYKDHHAFNRKELMALHAHYVSSISRSKVIVTTEKDAMRLGEGEAKEIFANIPVYYLPVEVYFHGNDSTRFPAFVEKSIKTFIHTHSKNIT